MQLSNPFMDIQNLAMDLVSALRSLPDLPKRPSVNSRRNLLSDVLRLNSAISTDDFQTDQLIPLLTTVVKEESDNLIWSQALAILAESTCLPKPLPFLDKTAFLHTASSFVNSSEQRKHIDAVLKEELGSMYTVCKGSMRPILVISRVWNHTLFQNARKEITR